MKTELQERADILAVNVQRSIDAGFEVLRSIAQLYASAQHIGRQDFKRFVQPALARHPSIHALEWLPRLADGDRAALEQAVQAEGYSGFQITEQSAEGAVARAKQRSEYFPVLYVEPLEGNERVLGFDLISDAIRRSAAERARDTGAIVTSGRIELVQEAQRQFGILVILPIYRQGTPSKTLATRRENFQGFILGVFRIADLIRAALPGLGLDHIDFSLYDKSDRPGNSFLAAYESSTKQVSASPNQEKSGVEITWRFPSGGRFAIGKGKPTQNSICTRSFYVADRQWSLLLQPTAAYVDHAELYEQTRIRADAATAQAEKLQQALQNLQETQARWFFEKKLIAVGVSVALLVLGGAGLLSHQNLLRLVDSKAATERSYQAIAILSILSATAAADTAPLIERSPAFQQDLDALRQIAAKDAQQHRRFEQLAPLIAQKLANPLAPLDRSLQQRIRQIAAEMEQTERSHLQEGQTQSQSSVQNTFWVNVLGVLLSFALLAGVYYLLQRQMTERQAIEVALFQVNHQLETEVQERRAELEETRELSDLKLRLFSMVSHEFRTPLSTILISTQSLTNSHEWSEEKRLKNLSRIQAAAKTLGQMLNDILTLNRAEAGKLEFRPEPIDLEQFCRHLIEEIQLSTAAPPIQFDCKGQCAEASLDSKLLHSILSNLLTNALKYSPIDRPVQFTLLCSATLATFEIRDQGIGISSEDQPHLYEAFYRGQNVGDVTGTGLGLAVVKTCVDRHKGQITLESQMDMGTTFTVMLPQG